MKREIWKDIPGYEGKYQASTFGRVKSLNYMHTGKEGLLKFGKRYTHGGDYYYKVQLYDKNGKHKDWSVHIVIAMTFIPNPDNLPEVNHKDENKLNNYVDNLEWCTRQYNLLYGTRIQRMSKRVACYDLNHNLIKIYDSISATAEDGFKTSEVSRICNGNGKGMMKHHNHYFEFIG